MLGHSKTMLVLLGGWAFLGDKVSLKQLAGMALAVLGMVFYGVASSQCVPYHDLLCSMCQKMNSSRKIICSFPGYRTLVCHTACCSLRIESLLQRPQLGLRRGSMSWVVLTCASSLAGGRGFKEWVLHRTCCTVGLSSQMCCMGSEASHGPCRKPVVKEIKPEKQALLSKGSGKGSGENRVDIQVTAGQVLDHVYSSCISSSPPTLG